MPLDKFLIAPIKNGTQLNVRPWMIMDDAFVSLTNAHVWRGRVKKRFGALSMNTTVSTFEQQLFSRLRVKIGTTNGSGNLSVTVPGAIFAVGQMFSCADEIYTVDATGTPATLLTTGVGTATYDTTTGAFVLMGGPHTTDVYFYPAQPVMALPTYNVSNVSDEQLIAFDTQFAYVFAHATGWQRLGTAIWTGTNADFHWATNYRGAASSDFLLFVVNNVVADVIKYWDGANWHNLSPVYDPTSGDVIRTAKIVIPFQNRLLLLNTTEQVGGGDLNFNNRVRWCQNGSPLTTDAWYQIPGKGNFIEAPVREAIISADFIKDRLIIFFEQSTWELVYTNNQIIPFDFRRIDTTLGLESQNSLVTFDKVLMGMGSTGIHACNGMNVDRIDQMIPDAIFDISNVNNGPSRVTGIRDYFTQEVYWSFNSAENADTASNTFPNTVLVYNYMTGSWANYDDNITAFGYYQNDQNLVWNDLDITWAEANFAWDDPSLQSLFRQVIAGNQEGFTFIVDSDVSKNAKSLSITNISISSNVITITAINHCLLTSEPYIYIENVVGTSTIANLNNAIFMVSRVIDVNTFQILANGIAGVYQGGGTITRVSQIFLQSKAYNFYNEVGKNIRIPRIDFLIDVNPNAQAYLDYSVSFSNLELVQESAVTNAITGNSVLDMGPLTELEKSQEQAWRNMYPILEGETIQYILTLNNTQMLDSTISFSAFELHAIIFYASKTSDFGNVI